MRLGMFTLSVAYYFTYGYFTSVHYIMLEVLLANARVFLPHEEFAYNFVTDT